MGEGWNGGGERERELGGIQLESQDLILSEFKLRHASYHLTERQNERDPEGAVKQYERRTRRGGGKDRGE